jgi:hypothetical protein
MAQWIRVRLGLRIGILDADQDSFCIQACQNCPQRPKKEKSKEILCLKSSLLGWKLLLKSDCSSKDFKKTHPVYIYDGFIETYVVVELYIFIPQLARLN